MKHIYKIKLIFFIQHVLCLFSKYWNPEATHLIPKCQGW